MGWASATHLFDGAVEVALHFLQGAFAPSPVPAVMIQAVVEKMYTDIDWEDWDTQDESDYFPYLVHVMHARDELDPGYYEWYTSDDPDNFDWSMYRGH